MGKWKNKISTPTYNSWKAMRQRVLAMRYPYGYGDIQICDEWLNDYDKFYEDMGERPDDTTLDRIDNSLGYSKDNCRWATSSRQNRNQKRRPKIKHNGKEQTIADWCDELGLTDKERFTVYKRYNAGYSNTFDELFAVGNLAAYKVAKRKNKCILCGKTDSIKWRKNGKICNTCYHKARRWKIKENRNIEEYPGYPKC